MPFLHANIRLALQCIVHAVGEIGDAGGQNQFQNLLLGKVPAQRLQMMIADGRGCACDLIGKMDYGLVLFVK